MLSLTEKYMDHMREERNVRKVKLLVVICGMLLLVSGCSSPKVTDTPSGNTLTGTWVLDLTQCTHESSDFEYIVETGNSMLYSLSLYDDETYVANFAFTQTGGNYDPDVGLIPDGTTKFYISDDEHTGSYSLVHDGNAISFDGTGYFDFELSQDVLVITGQQGGTYLYHRSGTIDRAGIYQLRELNGMTADQAGVDLTLELREDYLLGITQRIYTPDGTSKDVTEALDMGCTWRLEGDKLLFGISEGIVYKNLEAELNADGFTLTFENDGMVQEGVFELINSGES